MNNQADSSNLLHAEISQLSEVIKAQDFKTADIIANYLREKHPQQENIWMMSAEIKLSLSDYDSAFKLFEEAVRFSTSAEILVSFILILFKTGKYELCDKACRIIAARYQDAYNVLNIWGAALKQLKRFKESVECLHRAVQINPQEKMAFINMGNSYLAWQKNNEALEAFSQAVALDPADGESMRLQAMAYIALARYEEAERVLEGALQYVNEHPMIIVDLCATHYNRRDYDKALEVITKGAEQIPNNLGILRTKAIVLRQVGRIDEATHLFEDILKKYPDDVETIIALANAVYYGSGDGMKAKYYYNLAYSKDPNHQGLLHKLSHFLMTVRHVDTSEGENVDRAHEVALRMLEVTPSLVSISDAAQSVFLKVLDYENYDRLGSIRSMIDFWVNQGNIPPLTFQMSRVQTMEDRLYLVDAHRRWGSKLEEVARKKPIIRKVKRRINSKIRIGILSSDLRNHPVGYFTWPIVEHLDRSRFEIYCYSLYPNQPDVTQQNFMRQVDDFKIFGENHPHNIAQVIADDSLDILFELGGSTFFNKVDICAYRPAPVQVSWLGYPHSIGFPTTIDYIMVDPYINPENPKLIIEKPFIMPHTWVSLDKVGFLPTPITDVIPEDRNGYVTFGSMNMPHKLNPKLFALWAYIMNMVPNSRFLYVRPETGSVTLRKNFCDQMSQYGIASNRLSFVATRINHLDQYNNMDIALDPFPHTGGTTTCESLWMGVPVVTMVGPSFFERLSYSNLNNAGLPDLCAFSLSEYKNIALDLVQNKERRRYLRRNLRQQIGQHPLGQPGLFAKDFGETIISILGGSRMAV